MPLYRYSATGLEAGIVEWPDAVCADGAGRHRGADGVLLASRPAGHRAPRSAGGEAGLVLLKAVARAYPNPAAVGASLILASGLVFCGLADRQLGLWWPEQQEGAMAAIVTARRRVQDCSAWRGRSSTARGASASSTVAPGSEVLTVRAARTT